MYACGEHQRLHRPSMLHAADYVMLVPQSKNGPVKGDAPTFKSRSAWIAVAMHQRRGLLTWTRAVSLTKASRYAMSSNLPS